MKIMIIVNSSNNSFIFTAYISEEGGREEMHLSQLIVGCNLCSKTSGISSAFRFPGKNKFFHQCGAKLQVSEENFCKVSYY